MLDRLIGKIEYFLDPINIIREIINFILRKDILQIIIFYLITEYIKLHGFLEEYFYQFAVSFDILQNYVISLAEFDILNNAFFILIGAILLESYRYEMPSSIAHMLGEIICPALLFVSLWAMSGNIVFAGIIAILKHISGKGSEYLHFLNANNSSVYSV